MTGGRQLGPDEAKLWRVVASSVTPLTKARRSPATTEASDQSPVAAPVRTSATAKPASTARHKATPAARPTEEPLRDARPDKAMAVRAPVPDASGHKKVRRGRLEVQARIDLHGMTRAQAEHALAVFMPAMRARGFGCVLVITGKGLDVAPEDFLAPQPGVIRRRLPDWLNGARLRPHIASYAQAHARHGGSGAFYVLLKRPLSKP